MAVAAIPGVERSDIDSARFGVEIARADMLGPGEISRALSWCRDEGIDMLIARCPAGDMVTVHEFEEAGLRLMDAQVRFVGAAGSATGPDRRLRPARPEDGGRIVEIAAGSFAGYAGHYHADPRLPAPLSALVYPSWAGRCCSGEAADHVVVAEVEGTVVGFSAFARAGPGEGRLVLGAVAPEARGGRLYRAMALHGRDWCEREGLGRLSAITQTVNIAAQQSWIGAGMLPDSVWYTFHGWLR